MIPKSGYQLLEKVILNGLRFGLRLVGRTGVGWPRSRRYNLLSGIYRPSRGRVLLGGENVTGQPAHRLARRGLSRTFQNLQVVFRTSAAENVMVGRHLHKRRHLLAHLSALPSVVLVEHDMRLVMNISDRIHVLANGRTLAEGTASEVRADPAVIEAYLGIDNAKEPTRAHG